MPAPKGSPKTGIKKPSKGMPKGGIVKPIKGGVKKQKQTPKGAGKATASIGKTTNQKQSKTRPIVAAFYNPDANHDLQHFVANLPPYMRETEYEDKKMNPEKPIPAKGKKKK